MVEYKCQDCGTTIGFLSPDELERKIKAGDVIKGSRLTKKEDWRGDMLDHMQDGYWGYCHNCAWMARRQADSAGSERAADAQSIRIRERVVFIRERRKDLTFEQAVRAAVEDEFDPHNESDRGFRAYLLGEGAPKDTELDVKARSIIDSLGAVVAEETPRD